jgi:O-antigen/teichoic acid export membrane protein
MLAPKIINLLLLGYVILFYNLPVNAIYANLATSFLVSFLSLLFIFSVFKKLKVNYTPISIPFSKIWDLAWPMFLTSGLFMVMNQTDTLMLGYIKQPEDVGIYHISSRIAGITLFILTAMNYKSAPLYAELFHAKKHTELKNLVQRTAKIMFWMALPIVIIAVIGGKFLLGIFGNEFISGYFALLCIVFAEFIHAFSGSIGNFLNMTGHQKAFRNIILIGVFVNITLNFLLIPIYSYNGAAFATLISMLTWNIIGSIYIKRTFGYYIVYLPFLNKESI